MEHSQKAAVVVYDHVTKQAMPARLRARSMLASLLPLALQFYAAPSSDAWTHRGRNDRLMAQGDKGEHADSVLPFLAQSSQHRNADGRGGVRFLDDTHRHAPARSTRRRSPTVKCGNIRRHGTMMVVRRGKGMPLAKKSSNLGSSRTGAAAQPAKPQEPRSAARRSRSCPTQPVHVNLAVGGGPAALPEAQRVVNLDLRFGGTEFRRRPCRLVLVGTIFLLTSARLKIQCDWGGWQ